MSRWRGDPDTALVVPQPGAALLSGAFVEHCLSTLARRGYRRVVTSALSPLEQVGFLAAGFGVEQGLCLLSRGLGPEPTEVPAGMALRRAGRRGWDLALAVDHAAFGEFWRFDRRALLEAVEATPSARFRLAGPGREEVAGYAITGRSGENGYVQRLAVHPGFQRRGIGRRLLFDGLAWLARRGARTAWVNTQPDNTAALDLYRGAGFLDDPTGLAVLSVQLS